MIIIATHLDETVREAETRFIALLTHELQPMSVNGL